MKKNPYNYIAVILITITLGILGFFISSILPREYNWISWVLVAVAFMYINITRQSLINTLYDSVYHDPLTNLKSRKYFNSRLEDDLLDMEAEKSGLSLLMIDIDNFKKVNDTYGHLTGDEVLKQLALIFKHCVRASDAAVRWGGEEFAVILPGIGRDESLIIAERIRHTVEDYEFKHRNTILKITISVGVASVSGHIKIEELVELADKALYEAKKHKNLVCAA